MKAIFLDIDGVLNNDGTRTYTETSDFVFVDDYLIESLKEIIDETNAVVVLSSDWRRGLLEKEVRGDLEELKEKLREYKIEIYGYTPLLNADGEEIEIENEEQDEEDHFFLFHPRGTEIQKYLDKHQEIEEFVILDDRWDMKPNMGHLVNINRHYGIRKKDVENAIGVLNGKLVESKKGLW